MTVIITDEGFGPETWDAGFDGANMLDLASDTDPRTLEGKLDGIEMIRVDFPSFADGRGFTIARHLRLIGYKGRLRAKGHVISDQYAMARRTGFDEVEISDELAARQPEDQWQFRANWQSHNYQARMRATSNHA
ncbi:hypothetical protein NIT7321_00129 [Phaeobacter italicus]|jgi:uncharacterized protein (DUF934 family)|uniref:Oxidoreductase n=1 Tax=Phaeobacter italicus TaxID=481446 RepID=A0A0H5DCR9_9RHOB|nr:DUF934 domain-containing protein [Phaeobacter italicus]CRL09300.1 hypothetical protein NIT7321_00129 [Phaeobacter italicus]